MTNVSQTRDRLCRKGLTAEVLRSLVRYEPEIGEFIRLAAPARAVGKHYGRPAAAYLNDNGYALISLGRNWRFRAHQLAWLYMTGEWPDGDIDHINGVRHDNRWANLRAATRSQNIGNSRRPSDNLSGIKGVTFDKSRGKWRAQIGIGWDAERGYYNTKSLGRFDTKEEASAAYARAAEKRFGEFARTA